MRLLALRVVSVTVIVVLASIVGFGGGTTMVRAGELAALTSGTWDGTGRAAVGESTGLAANPAALIELQTHSLGVAMVQSVDQVGGFVIVYDEPDGGLGAGQIGYGKMHDDDREAARFAYSAAKPVGHSMTVGFGITHTKLEAPGEDFSAWGLDVGLFSRLSDGFRMGASVQNALLLGDAKAKHSLPPLLTAGAALDLGPVTVWGDWLVQGREAPFAQGHAYGLEARFGPLHARIGEHRFPDALARYMYYGLGFRFDRGRLDITLREGPNGPWWALGFALFF